MASAIARRVLRRMSRVMTGLSRRISQLGLNSSVFVTVQQVPPPSGSYLQAPPPPVIHRESTSWKTAVVRSGLRSSRVTTVVCPTPGTAIRAVRGEALRIVTSVIERSH